MKVTKEKRLVVAKIFDVSWKIGVLIFLWAIWLQLDDHRFPIYDIRDRVDVALLALDPYGSVLNVEAINNNIWDRDLLNPDQNPPSR